MKHIWKIFLLVAAVGVVSCQKEEPAADPGTFIVDFSAMAQTKALSAFVPANRTVRIVVYRSHQGATTPDFTRELLADNTYYFSNGANASLTACTVDALGFTRTGNGPAMTLPCFAKNDPGYFDIYAYSPAIPLETDGKSVTVKNNIDFMATSLIGYQIPALSNIASATIALPDMTRYCSAIAFRDIYTESNTYLALPVAGKNAATDRYQGISIDNLCAEGTYVLGADSIAVNRSTVLPTLNLLNSPSDNPATKVPTMNNPYISGTLTRTRLGSCTNAGTTSTYASDLYVLPCAAENPVAKNKFSLRIDLRFWSSAVSLTANSPAGTLITPALDGKVFKKGFRTEYNIKVVYDGVSITGIVFPTNPIKDWEPGDEYDEQI